MEGRHKRRALAASGHIATAEVADDGDAGQLCQQRWIADLNGETALGFMTHRLAVAADGAYGFGREVLLGE